MPRNALNEFEKGLRKQISENLKKYTPNITQNELSKLTGIPASTISGYFAMRSTPNATNVQKLADALNCSKADLDPRFTDKLIDITKSAPTKNGKRDIQKQLQMLLDELEDKEFINFYNGNKKMDDEARELLKISLEASIRLARSLSK
ncbi:MAG: helix-turn-helix transcriptional regulator [Veillonella sp.]|uniref:helix-turn-helix domain-containing protein n=1 Tax=Veillonella sp. TaxID=1926307 RepID=UPI0025F77CCB|nr:helix-turn-helix transcriptional regulator [Veillonella sp.]MBE6079398.1 helix-turn-helix transcriptional regulator [Veillonella sp.]